MFRFRRSILVKDGLIEGGRNCSILRGAVLADV